MLLNYLKPMAIFAAVVETGSFTLAGKRLGMPRGKVSEQISRLESYLEVKLFQRSTRKVNITPEGQALYQHVCHIMRHGVEGVEEVKSFAEEVKGKIRITTTNDFYEHLLLPILKRFCQNYPEVELDLQITELPLSIIDDSIDLAIRSGELPDSGLISLPLAKTHLKVYASPELKDSLPDSPEQLNDYRWIAMSEDAKVSQFKLVSQNGGEFTLRPHYQHVASSVASYSPLIEQNFGLGMMTEHTGKVLVAQGRLIPVLPDWSHQSMSISLLYPARLHMARRTKLLIDEIKLAFCSPE